MRRSRILVSLALVVGLSAAGSALGQGDERPFVTALGPDAQGARLEVQARPGGLCVRVLWSDMSESGSESCSDLPRVDLVSPFVADGLGGGPSGAQAVGGAVRAGVARVEYVLSDGRRVAADTVAVPQLGGRLARALRYFLLQLPAGGDPVTRRMLDASGRVVDEEDGLFGLGPGAEPAPLKAPVRIARGRSGGARWSLYASVRNQLEPVRGEAGRRVPTVCTATSRASSDAFACDDASRTTFGVGIEPGCPGRGAALLHGVAGPSVRVEVLLGDRRLHPARMVALPPGYAQAGARAWVFAVPFDAAVQSVRARTANGRLMSAVDLNQPPPRLNCEGGDFGVGVFELTSAPAPPAFTTPPAVLQPAGGPALTVRDADAELCVAVGASGAERTCLPPAPYLIFPLIATARDGSVAGGAVDPAIAAIVTTASDGSRHRVATDPGAGYAGRYAGLVRFFSVAAPRGARLVSMVALDARGRRLFEWPLTFEFPPVGRQRRILTGRALGGRFDLVQARYSIPFLHDSVSCLSVVRHGRRAKSVFDCLASPDEGKHIPTRQASGDVGCDLRAAVIVGGAPRAAATVRMRLDDGSTRPGRVFGSTLGRAFLAVPPSGRGLRRIEIADRAGRILRTFATRVPPAARQCGYVFGLSAEQRPVPPPPRPRAVRAAVPPRVSQPYATYRSLRLTPVPWRRR